MFRWALPTLLLALPILLILGEKVLTPKKEGYGYEIFEHNGIDYAFVYNKSTHQEARMICKYQWRGELLKNPDLLTISAPTNFTKSFMFRALSQSNFYDGDAFWMQLERGQDRRLRHTTPLELYTFTYPQDYTGYPYNGREKIIAEMCTSDTGSCFYLKLYRQDNFCISSTECDARRSYICKIRGDYIAKNMDWIQEGQIKYKISPTRLTFAEANAACLKFGIHAKLAVFPDLYHAYSIAKFLQIGRPRLGRAWIRGNVKHINESFYDEYDSKCRRIENTPCANCWFIHKYQEISNCTALGATVRCARCDIRRPYICQKQAHADSVDICELDKWDLRIHYTPQTWIEARRICESTPTGRLVTITTNEMLGIIVLLMESQDLSLKHIWLGASFKNNNWTWEYDKTTVPKVAGADGFPPWAFGISTTSKKTEKIERHNRCLNLDREFVATPIFYGTLCSFPQQFICQYDKTTICTRVGPTTPFTPTTNT